MLVQSKVGRTLGIKNHIGKDVMEDEEGLVIELDIWKGWRRRCGTRGHRYRVRDRLKEREWKHVLLWGIPTKVRYRSARVRCETCGKVRVEEIPWGQGKCRLSTGLILLRGANSSDSKPPSSTAESPALPESLARFKSLPRSFPRSKALEIALDTPSLRERSSMLFLSRRIQPRDS